MHLQDIAPRALVRAMTSGSEVKFKRSDSKPFNSITSCWLRGLFWTIVVTTSAALARIFAWEFLRYPRRGCSPPIEWRSVSNIVNVNRMRNNFTQRRDTINSIVTFLFGKKFINNHSTTLEPFTHCSESKSSNPFPGNFKSSYAKVPQEMLHLLLWWKLYQKLHHISGP